MNGKPIRILQPRLSICLTGTPNQLVRLIPTAEDGLFSRFTFLTQPTQLEWLSAAPTEGERDYEQEYRRLGEEVLEMHLQLLQSPTRVHFSKQQWKRHTALFEARLNEVKIENNPAAAAVVFRHGLIAMRMAAIFTVLRKWEDRLMMDSRYCTDTDFEAALQIALTGMEHALLVSSSLPDARYAAMPLKPFYRIKQFLELLPPKTAYSDMLRIAEQNAIPVTTAKRYIRKAISLNLLIHKDKIYSKPSQPEI